MQQSNYFNLLLFSPLLGAMISYVLSGIPQSAGTKISSRRNFPGFFAFLSAVVSFAAAAMLFYLQTQVGESPAPGSIGKSLAEPLRLNLGTWFEIGSIKASFSFLLDNLSTVMSLVVTGVGSLIFLFSIAYMREDEGSGRFFAYLCLFLFAMLLLILADNLLLMFAGWEGVGLCSYLLIGFWYKERENTRASLKAFLVNRMADVGLLLGIIAIGFYAGSFEFAKLSQLVPIIPREIQYFAGICLLIGAIGKSAQVPFHIWLPDAMAGPTPVSALIHAATMVTAGIYLITRTSFLFVGLPEVNFAMLILGVTTAFIAATIALVQNDIKKVLAYSTVSQLGFMFIALGVQAYSVAIFHVVTHAFFKACLFLSAGSVIMSTHHQQDMRFYGGLYKKLPITFICYLLSTLAIVGMWGFSGFYSKDAILWALYSDELSTSLAPKLQFLPGIISPSISVKIVLFYVAVFTAFLTAVYMTRSLLLTFMGKYRGDEHEGDAHDELVIDHEVVSHHQVKEGGIITTLPLIVLAIFSLGFAMVYGDKLLQFLSSWSRSDLNLSHHQLAELADYQLLEIKTLVSMFIGLGVGFLVWKLSVRNGFKGSGFFLFKPFKNLFERKWYFDALNELVLVRAFTGFARFLCKGVEQTLSLIFDSLGMSALASGEFLRVSQNGRLNSYLWQISFCMVLILIFFIVL